MITLRSIIDKVNGLRYMFENLDIKSGLGKQYLLSQEFLYAEDLLFQEIGNVSKTYSIVNNDENSRHITKLLIKLEHIHDIKGTLKNIANASVLDDVELFEVKSFTLLAMEIKELIEALKLEVISIPDLEAVIDILDPDKQRIAHFYIYPSYSEELARLRKKYESLLPEQPDIAEEIRLKCIDIEDKIRENLSRQLFEHTENLSTTLNSIAYLDVLVAKALQAKKMNLCEPRISKEETRYSGLFNPEVKELLESQAKSFQAIDISMLKSPSLITGANMAGKTVVLKTVALSQYLFQLGFFVPAISADIVPVEDIIVSMGDDQSEMNGLSSFAAEMLNVNKIIKAIRSNKNILALIDELARTTNPEEGRSIVNATIDILESKKVRALITTHYNGLNTSCRKLRVKGLITEKIDSNITIENINDYMDYSLIEDNSNVVPMEALRIASVLGIDEDLLKRANDYTKRQ